MENQVNPQIQQQQDNMQDDDNNDNKEDSMKDEEFERSGEQNKYQETEERNHRAKKAKSRKKNRIMHEDGYDDNFIGDTEDEEKLEQMNDLQRELEIQRRREQREKNEQMKQFQKIDQDNKPKTQIKDKVKDKTRERSKEKEIKNQKKNKTSKNYFDSHSDSDDSFNEDDDDDNDDDSDDMGYHKRSAQFKKKQQQNQSQQENIKFTEQTTNDNEISQKLSEAIEKITRKRSVLESIINRSDFDTLVSGSFIKISFSKDNIQVAQIVKVEQSEKFYKLADNVETDKLIVVKILTTTSGGVKEFKEKTLELTYVSNKDVTEKEITTLITEQQKLKQNPLTLKYIQYIAEKWNSQLKQKEQQQSKSYEKVKQHQIKDLIANIDKMHNYSFEDLKKNKIKIQEESNNISTQINWGELVIDKDSELKAYLNALNNYLSKCEQEIKSRSQQANVNKKQHTQSKLLSVLIDQNSEKQRKYQSNIQSQDKAQNKLKKLYELEQQYVDPIDFNKKIASYDGFQQIKDEFLKMHLIPCESLNNHIIQWMGQQPNSNTSNAVINNSNNDNLTQNNQQTAQTSQPVKI